MPPRPSHDAVLAWIRASALLLAGAALVPCASGAASVPGPLVAGSEPDFAPYAMIDPDGKASGYSVDLINAVARETGLQLQVHPGPWSVIRRQLEAGEIQALPLMAVSPERAEKVLFSDAHITAYDSVFVRADDHSIRSFDDLRAGRTVLVMNADMAHDYLARQRPQVALRLAGTLREALLRLSQGEADAVVCSQVAGWLAIREHGIPRVTEAENPRVGAYRREFAFAVRKGDRALQSLLNEGLKAVRASGEYSRIYFKWFGDVDPELRARALRERTTQAALLIALALAALVSGFVLTLRSQVRRQTARLRASEEQFRSLILNLPCAVYRCRNDADWTMLYLSGEMERISGYPAEEFLDNRVRSFASVIHPEDQEPVARAVAGALARGEPYELEYRVVHRDGSFRWVNEKGRLSSELEGAGEVLDGVIFDVTEKRRIAEQLEEQRTQALSSARLSILGEMAGGIAHEINNPLAIICGTASRLRIRAAEGPLEVAETAAAAERIERTGFRIARIVKALRAVARDAAEDPCERTPVSALVADTLELCQERLRQHGIALEVEAPPPEVLVECQSVQIVQALLNLVANADHAVAASERKRIRIEARDLGDWIEIAVSDSGPGVPPELRERIFQPFFTTKDPGVGTGLGLSISRRIADAHGGALLLDPASAETRFVIRLPKRFRGGSSAAPAAS